MDDLRSYLAGREVKPSRAHQVEGVRWLLPFDDPAAGRVHGGGWFIADEVGAGKTKQVIDAACALWERGEIERVLVVGPTEARSLTWYSPELGELNTHLWPDLPVVIEEYHQKIRRWTRNHVAGQRHLRWVITNYEFIRSLARRDALRPYCDSKTLLVLDESLDVSNHRAQQTKAVLSLRRDCGRAILLNGTPGTPFQLFTQAALLAPDSSTRALGSKILGCSSFTHFRARYAIMGGFQGRQVIQWRDLDDLQRRMAPYTIRRLKKDCLDLPPALPPTTLEVRLDESTWKIYKEMRDELCVWLDAQTVAISAHAGTKAMRLAQICNGFVGGVVDAPEDPDEDAPGLFDADAATADARPADGLPGRPDWVKPASGAGRLPDWAPRVSRFVGQRQEVNALAAAIAGAPRSAPPVTREVGDEKLRWFLAWAEQVLTEDDTAKVVAWCRYRPQAARYGAALADAVRAGRLRARVGALHGGQSRDEREAAVRLLDPKTADPRRAAFVIGTVGTGARALNFSAAHRALYLSNDYRTSRRTQSEGRLHRPPQTHPVWYGDVIAAGPAGQKTIEHVIVKALRANIDLQTWTCAAWVRALREE